jgi:hypothetical protein
MLGACLMLLSPVVCAGLVLVANPKCGVERLEKDEVVNIYLGRYRRLPSGITAEPYDQPGDNENKSLFYRKLVDKSLAEINAYWSRLVFSGKTRPPQVAANAEEALQRVAARPGAFAYVERNKVDKRVIVVFELDD